MLSVNPHCFLDISQLEIQTGILLTCMPSDMQLMHAEVKRNAFVF